MGRGWRGLRVAARLPRAQPLLCTQHKGRFPGEGPRGGAAWEAPGMQRGADSTLLPEGKLSCGLADALKWNCCSYVNCTLKFLWTPSSLPTVFKDPVDHFSFFLYMAE